jgi:hypothetical protein
MMNMTSVVDSILAFCFSRQLILNRFTLCHSTQSLYAYQLRLLFASECEHENNKETSNSYS